MQDLSRREFVGTVAAATVACGLCGGGVALAAAPAGSVNVGPLEDIKQDGVSDKYAAAKRFFLIRQNGQVYASSSACTHQGALIHAEPDQHRLRCPKHGSIFDYAGNVVSGKARWPLVRYAIKVDAEQHVIVDTSKTFAQKDWKDPAAFVALKK